MKKPTKVQAPEGCQFYLTAGKVYDVVSFDPYSTEDHGYGFTIINDMGTESYCLELQCGHLNYGNWIIVETE
jgi:hypothetical protein